MAKVFPTGTNVKDIPTFDRRSKIAFECKQHKGKVWSAKDPWSSWFSNQAEDNGCRCTVYSGAFVLVADYSLVEEKEVA